MLALEKNFAVQVAFSIAGANSVFPTSREAGQQHDFHRRPSIATQQTQNLRGVA